MFAMTAVKELRALEADSYLDMIDTPTPTESTGTRPLHARILSTLVWSCGLGAVNHQANHC